jgi:phytol kinase
MLFIEFLVGFGILIGYFIICALSALLFRHFVEVPKEVFRKILHLILLGSLPVFVYAFSAW